MQLNTEECVEDATYERHLVARYGIYADEYNQILDKQGGVCGICGSSEPITKNGRFVVDHCHKTGQIRGLLCLSCNTAIGRLGDDIPAILRALHYLLQADGCTSIADWVEGRSKRIKVYVIKASRRAFLCMKYTCPDTQRQIMRSTRTSDPAVAKEMAVAWEAELNARYLGGRNKLGNGVAKPLQPPATP